MRLHKVLWVLGLLAVFGLFGFSVEKIKAGFIYVGPIGDYGWSHAHDVARRIVDEKFDWLETVYVESVPKEKWRPTLTNLCARAAT